jgi:hypothetical protein
MKMADTLKQHRAFSAFFVISAYELLIARSHLLTNKLVGHAIHIVSSVAINIIITLYYIRDHLQVHLCSRRPLQQSYCNAVYRPTEQLAYYVEPPVQTEHRPRGAPTMAAAKRAGCWGVIETAICWFWVLKYIDQAEMTADDDFRVFRPAMCQQNSVIGFWESYCSSIERK